MSGGSRKDSTTSGGGYGYSYTHAHAHAHTNTSYHLPQHAHTTNARIQTKEKILARANSHVHTHGLVSASSPTHIDAPSASSLARPRGYKHTLALASSPINKNKHTAHTKRKGDVEKFGQNTEEGQEEEEKAANAGDSVIDGMRRANSPAGSDGIGKDNGSSKSHGQNQGDGYSGEKGRLGSSWSFSALQGEGAGSARGQHRNTSADRDHDYTEHQSRDHLLSGNGNGGRADETREYHAIASRSPVSRVLLPDAVSVEGTFSSLSSAAASPVSRGPMWQINSPSAKLYLVSDARMDSSAGLAPGAEAAGGGRGGVEIGAGTGGMQSLSLGRGAGSLAGTARKRLFTRQSSARSSIVSQNGILSTGVDSNPDHDMNADETAAEKYSTDGNMGIITRSPMFYKSLSNTDNDTDTQHIHVPYHRGRGSGSDSEYGPESPGSATSVDSRLSPIHRPTAAYVASHNRLLPMRSSRHGRHSFFGELEISSADMNYKNDSPEDTGVDGDDTEVDTHTNHPREGEDENDDADSRSCADSNIVIDHSNKNSSPSAVRFVPDTFMANRKGESIAKATDCAERDAVQRRRKQKQKKGEHHHRHHRSRPPATTTASDTDHAPEKMPAHQWRRSSSSAQTRRQSHHSKLNSGAGGSVSDLSKYHMYIRKHSTAETSINDFASHNARRDSNRRSSGGSTGTRTTNTTHHTFNKHTHSGTEDGENVRDGQQSEKEILKFLCTKQEGEFFGESAVTQADWTRGANVHGMRHSDEETV